MISLLAGVAFSPHGGNLIRPLEYAYVLDPLTWPGVNPVLTCKRRGSQASLDTSILYFSRLVLGVQLVLAGVQLPSRYLKKQWRPLSILLGPIMVAMWLATSLLVWALVPDIPFLHALAIGSCVTPTVSTNVTSHATRECLCWEPRVLSFRSLYIMSSSLFVELRSKLILLY